MVDKKLLLTLADRLLKKSIESIETYPICYALLIILLYIVVTHYIDDGLAFLLGLPPYDSLVREVSYGD